MVTNVFLLYHNGCFVWNPLDVWKEDFISCGKYMGITYLDSFPDSQAPEQHISLAYSG